MKRVSLQRYQSWLLLETSRADTKPRPSYPSRTELRKKNTIPRPTNQEKAIYRDRTAPGDGSHLQRSPPSEKKPPENTKAYPVPSSPSCRRMSSTETAPHRVTQRVSSAEISIRITITITSKSRPGSSVSEPIAAMSALRMLRIGPRDTARRLLG